MNTQATLPAVSRSVTVKATADKAFRVFTESFAAWWPAEHHINPAGYVGAYIEPEVGGRWYERAEDGSECDWGRVLEWEPPHRVLLSWHLNGEFEYDPDPDRASEVEVRFVAESDGSTRVEVQHRKFDRVVGAERLREGVGGQGGWNGLLRRFDDLIAGRDLTSVG